MLGASAWTVALPRIAFASRRDPGDSEEVPAATDSFARRPYYVDETLAEAEEKVATETEIRSSVRAGMLPLEAYERYGTF